VAMYIGYAPSNEGRKMKTFCLTASIFSMKSEVGSLGET
jgi:hypothetical protein